MLTLAHSKGGGGTAASGQCRARGQKVAQNPCPDRQPAACTMSREGGEIPAEMITPRDVEAASIGDNYEANLTSWG